MTDKYYIQDNMIVNSETGFRMDIIWACDLLNLKEQKIKELEEALEYDAQTF